MNNLTEEIRYIHIDLFKNKLYITKRNNDTTEIDLNYDVDSEVVDYYSLVGVIENCKKIVK